jgi:hypothetical protein
MSNRKIKDIFVCHIDGSNLTQNSLLKKGIIEFFDIVENGLIK